MEENRKKTIIRTILAIVILMACGGIGYVNRGRQDLSVATTKESVLLDESPYANELGYCSDGVRLCVVAFGFDNANNTLIVIKNYDPSISELYVVTKPAAPGSIYACQRVKFSTEIFYCLGNQIPNLTSVTLEIYKKPGDRLVASGEIFVQYPATPVATATQTQEATFTPTSTVLSIRITETLTVTPAYP